MYRRAVFSIMAYNQEHQLSERWYLSDRALQSLAGGRKDFIKQYKETHAEEIEAHHRALSIRRALIESLGSHRFRILLLFPMSRRHSPGVVPLLLPINRRRAARCVCLVARLFFCYVVTYIFIKIVTVTLTVTAKHAIFDRREGNIITLCDNHSLLPHK